MARRNQRRENAISFRCADRRCTKKDFSDPQFYLFTKKELLQLQKVNMSRFKNVRRKIHLFPDTLTLKKAIAAKPEIVTWFERQINRKRNKYLNRWDVVVPRTLFSLNRL